MNDLRLVAKTPEPADIIQTIDAITSALDRGLKSFADDDGIIELSVKIDGVSYNDEKFFALVEKLGPATVPALTLLLAKCCADADLPHVWFGDLEDGQQAFGTAAKALAGIDAAPGRNSSNTKNGSLPLQSPSPLPPRSPRARLGKGRKQCVSDNHRRKSWSFLDNRAAS